MANINKTVIIWDELNADLFFFVIDGDQTKFNEVYINAVTDEEELLDELNTLIYKDDNSGQFAHEPLDFFPVEAVRDGAAVIVAGFLP